MSNGIMLTELERQKLELKQKKALLARRLAECFVATDLKSRAIGTVKKAQEDTVHRGLWIVAANGSGKCLVTGTLVATPTGPVPIEQLKHGDTVYSEYGLPIKVVGVYYQGKQEVKRIIDNKKVVAEATSHHRWLMRDGSEAMTATLDGRNIARVRVKAPLGSINEPHAYALGAMLGDGCCLQKTVNYCISSQTDEIPKKVAACLGGKIRRLHEDNYSWVIEPIDHNPIPMRHYKAWCKNKKAHEKIADVDVIRHWNRESILRFLAGLIDTDGCVEIKKDPERLPRALVRLSMQAKSVIEAAKWCFLALWQVDAAIYLDDRDKYKNGPVYNLTVSTAEDIQTVMSELAPYLIERKGSGMLPQIMACKGRYANRPVKTVIEDVAGEQDTWDIEVDSPSHLFLLANGFVSHNTSFGAREIAWWFNGEHPFKPRLPEWGPGPLCIVVSCKTTTILHEVVWKEKLKPLVEGNYEIDKEENGIIRKITNKYNGNYIIFLVHNDAVHARERLQGFTAHITWIDEMPDHSSYLSELLTRMRAGNRLDPDAPLAGYFYGTFTPLVEDEGVRLLVEEAKFPFVRYNFQMEDNPFYADWTSEALDAYVRNLCQDEVEFRARRYGEWYYSTTRVFKGYDPVRNRTALPFQYNPKMQHALIVDPSASGLTGVSLAVLDPVQVQTPTGPRDRWWIVKSKKLDGAAASLLIPRIEAEFVDKSSVYLSPDGRICDCSPSGFYKEAQVQKLPYRPYRMKNDRKKESIEKTNTALYNGLLMLAEGSDTDELHTELLSAKWKNSETEIKNSHKFHCADTLRYLWEMKPKRIEVPVAYESFGHALKAAWEREKIAREKAAEKREKKQPLRRNPSVLLRRMRYGGSGFGRR